MYEKDGKMVLPAIFVNRPNRFILEVLYEGAIVKAHLPNPGRLWELLYPGVTIYMVRHGGENHKTKFRVIGIEREHIPIMLDTHYCNDIAEILINAKQVPGWEHYRVVNREITVGHSRFDLLLADDESGQQFLVEVKSCTLFSKQGAMFPDAITDRGRKHLIELHALAKEGVKVGVLFLVQWEHARWFLPDYHTDLAFSQTFLEVAPALDWKALALKWDHTFSKPIVRSVCIFDESTLAREAHDKGDYLIVLHLQEEKILPVGSKGNIVFPSGYYVYVGSAKANLTKRIERHQRKRKKKHWHLDYLRNECEWIAALPIRSSSDLECQLADSLQNISEWYIEGFGCSDCYCQSHLFGFTSNPVHTKAFMNVVEYFRMNRLDEVIVKDIEE